MVLTRNQLVTPVHQLLGKTCTVTKDLFLVSLELWHSYLLESNNKTSDGVVVNTALKSWKDSCVDLVITVIEDLFALLGCLLPPLRHHHVLKICLHRLSLCTHSFGFFLPLGKLRLELLDDVVKRNTKR
jgi:hypothetical protein